MLSIIKNKYLLLISLVSVLFYLSAGFDLFPFLRGPAPYPPEWQRPYFFVNTLDRIWMPILTFIIIFLAYRFGEKNEQKVSRHIKTYLIALVVLSFLFQLSVLFFSRSGIQVLVHRIINPELNGYFTASLIITSLIDFIRTYNENVLNFVYHAASHPPGAILFFYVNNLLVSFFPDFTNLISGITPNHTDVKLVWDSLSVNQKGGAVFSAFFIPLLASISIIPLYFAGCEMYGVKGGIRAVFIYLFIPSAVLFIPINDSFLPIFSITSFLFFYKAINRKNKWLMFLSGLFLFCGVFFNLSLLPFILFLAAFYILQNVFNKIKLKLIFGDLIVFAAGFLLLPLLFLMIFDFNFFELIQIIMTTVTHVNSRSYSLWLWFNVVDFFIFAGIPLAAVFFLKMRREIDLFITGIKRQKYIKNFRQIDFFFTAFVLMFLAVNFSGSVRGETGRILVIFMPFLALVAAGFLTEKLKFTTFQFGIFLLLQFIQILVMQEFWVMLW